MTQPLQYLCIDVATIVCSALFGVRVILGRPQLLTSRLVAIICFNNICHILVTRYFYGGLIPPPYRIDVGGWAFALNMARNTTAGVFMILCFVFFTDRKRVPLPLLGLFFVQVALDTFARSLLPEGFPNRSLFTQTVPGLLQTCFAVFSLYWIVGEWRADLIEKRRRIRAFTSVAIGLILVGSNALRIGSAVRDPMADYAASETLIGISLIVLLMLLYRSTKDDFDEPLPKAVGNSTGQPVRAEAAEEAAAHARLLDLLEKDRIYRSPNLDLSLLANKVGLPEYRLRKLINERLGYRNFNVFLHTYRVRDACEHLRDPAQRRTPILTIALSLGYQSVNTFNRGFRDVMGVTPSAYRNGDVAQAEAGKTSPEAQ